MQGGDDDLAGLDVELAAVEIAFDDVVFDIAFRQRTGPMRTGIVGDVEFAVELYTARMRSPVSTRSAVPAATSSVLQSSIRVAMLHV